MSFQILYYVASYWLVAKISNIALITIASPLKRGALDLFLCSNHPIGNKHHDRNLNNVRFSVFCKAFHIIFLKMLPKSAAHIDI